MLKEIDDRVERNYDPAYIVFLENQHKIENHSFRHSISFFKVFQNTNVS
jgi:hypothetical protein